MTPDNRSDVELAEDKHSDAQAEIEIDIAAMSSGALGRALAATRHGYTYRSDEIIDEAARRLRALPEGGWIEGWVNIDVKEDGYTMDTDCSCKNAVRWVFNAACGHIETHQRALLVLLAPQEPE